jgi:hypothetical protein
VLVKGGRKRREGGIGERRKTEGWICVSKGEGTKEKRTEGEGEEGGRKQGGLWAGLGERGGGQLALVPVLIFTAKASSWPGTRRSVSSLATMPVMWYSSFGLRSRSVAVTSAMTVPG